MLKDMKITKFGHCCLHIEEDGVHILTDPGNYCDTPELEKLDAILITHEHADHCHIPALVSILEKHPEVPIITHPGVGALLRDHGIEYTPILDGAELTIEGVKIASHGTEHACIHPDFPKVTNTGFMIANKLFYPGDSLHVPPTPVEVLALPVAGPWLKIQEAVEYAKAVNPKIVFPVHDGMLRQDHRMTPTRFVPQTLLEPLGIDYQDMTEGSEITIP